MFAPLNAGKQAVWVLMSIQDFPKTELQYHQRFSSEEACRAYLVSIRWPNGFVCANCGCTKYWIRKQKYRDKNDELRITDYWMCANCSKVTSLLSGTILHHSARQLPEWMNVIYQMSTSKQGISALELMRTMNFGSFHTAKRLLRELRRGMGVALSKQAKLRGPIEFDSTTWGRPDVGGKRGRGKGTGIKIFGAVEILGDGCGRVRLETFKKFDQESVAAFALKYIDKRSIIYADNDPAFQILTKLGFTLETWTVTETEEETAARREDNSQGIRTEHKAIRYLPRIHRIFSLVHRVNLGTHQGSYSFQHVQSNLDEYCFRFEWRNRAQLFLLIEQLVKASMQTKAMPYWQSCGRATPRRRIGNQESR